MLIRKFVSASVMWKGS